MNRPRNRNPSNRGRGRGGGGASHSPHQSYGHVPASSQVVPGAGVSIVLKIDQPTGRQVQGIVAEVLGRGDHPRGIKVRLADGRVGRVQKVVSVDEAQAASAGLENLGRDGEPAQSSSGVRGRQGSTRGPQVGGIVQDARTDGHDYEHRGSVGERPSLLDYVKNKPRRQRSKRRKGDEDEEQPLDSGGKRDKGDGHGAESVKCPICGNFEGDEEAVNHHVNTTHFQD